MIPIQGLSRSMGKISVASVSTACAELLASCLRTPFCLIKVSLKIFAMVIPDASDEEVLQSIRLAHLEEFIAQLPQGSATVVGERGLKLSGGEKQRVAIARTILKRPPILVFDEATSSLDSKSERSILSALQEISQGHTSMVIAHRLSTVIDADRIIVLDQGGMVEQGSHRELLSQKGHYFDLWTAQQRDHQ